MSLLNRQQLAKKFGVNQQTIRNWEAKGLPVHSQLNPPSGAWQYDEDATTDWYNLTINKTEDSNSADLRKKVADATLSELKVIKQTYQNIDIKTSISIYERQCSNIRAKLIALSSSLSGRIPDLSNYQERYEIIDAEIALILSELTLDNMTVKEWQKVAREADKAE